MYDVLIKSGVMIDASQGINDRMDIGISDGRIAAVSPEIAPERGRNLIDASGKIVAPGLIDIHAHVTDGLTPIGVNPDEDGVFSGITTACDGGSTGYANFPGFRKFVIEQAQTEILCFLSLHSTGQAVMPEIWDWRLVDGEAIIKTIEENRYLVKGVKVRAVCAMAETLGVDLIKTAKKIARESSVPVMLHVGKDPVENCQQGILESLTREGLDLLEAGDILTHVFTPKLGQTIKPDGSVLHELKGAVERGVFLDVAQGSGNLSFEIAKKAMSQGILPHTLSTDMSTFFPARGFALTALMSKFLAMGMTVSQVIEMTTINPARILSEEERRGSLKVGRSADISILELKAGEFVFVDSLKNTITGDSLLVPSLTLKAGEKILPRFDGGREGQPIV